VSNTTQIQPERLRRLSGARGQGVSAADSLLLPFGHIADAKPMDTCAYPRLGWSANTHRRSRL